MKLTIEKHPEFSRLAQYFKTIEDLAENLGMEVDDLLPNHHFRKTSGHPSLHRMALVLGEQRVAVFRRMAGSDADLRAIVNENYLNK